jgi:hypothetical protein
MRTSAHEAAQFDRRARSSAADASLKLRLRVYMTRPWLDRRIAASGPGATSAALELRARQLTSTRARNRLAQELRGLVEYAQRMGSRPTFSAVVIDRRAVAGGRYAILGLAERLEGREPVSARGMTLVRRFLTDGLGPLFNPRSEQTVIQVVWNIEDAFEESETAAPVL